MVKNMIDLNDLTELKGVGEGAKTKLNDAGIFSIISVATLTPAKLSELTGTTETGARKIIQQAREICKIGFENAVDVEKKSLSTPKISTHCSAIDKLLGGGLEIGTSLEIYAEGASGKTNISHLLAVSAIKQFPESYVVWIDTENTFRASRIRDFCKGLEMDPEYVLQHIIIGKAISADHQILLTDNIEQQITKDKKDIKLVIVDSVMNHFRAEFAGRATLADRQQTLNKHLHTLARLSDAYRFAVYMTNQVQSNPGMAFGDPLKAIGGNIMSHFATTRAYIRKCGKNTRKMILIDSPNLPSGEVLFSIEETKLESVDKEE